MNTIQADKKDLWTLVYDLVFSVPQPLLAIVACAIAVLVVVGVTAVVVRFWRGDKFEVGPIKVERPEIIADLKTSLEAISKDDRLKKNVLWAFRERLNEANDIINNGIEEPAVKVWCHGVLTDIITALSEGGHDRHRASLWIRRGDVLRMFNGMGFRQEAVDHATLPLVSIAGNVLKTGTSYKSTDVDADVSFSPKPRSGPAYKSLLAVPVKNPLGTTIAALCVDAEAPGYFDSDHEFFANCFADLIALLVAQVVAGDHP